MLIFSSKIIGRRQNVLYTSKFLLRNAKSTRYITLQWYYNSNFKMRRGNVGTKEYMIFSVLCRSRSK